MIDKGLGTFRSCTTGVIGCIRGRREGVGPGANPSGAGIHASEEGG